MSDVIAVLNAGSSSIKFSLFTLRDDQAELLGRGQIEGIYTAPRFITKDKAGAIIAEKSWPEARRSAMQEQSTTCSLTYVPNSPTTICSVLVIVWCTAGSIIQSRCA